MFILRVWNLAKKILYKLKYSSVSYSNNENKDISRLNIHQSSILRNFFYRFDNPVEGRKYLSIGKDCIISGNYIFESQDGYISIGNHTYIGGGTYISHNRIEIGDNVTIAWGGTVYDHDSHSLNYLDRRKDIDDELDDIRNGRNFILHKDWSNVNSKPIKICDDAWIGMNVTILKGVTIGEGAIVGACSVVTKDVPAWTVVAGNPAKVIKIIKKDEKTKRRVT